MLFGNKKYSDFMNVLLELDRQWNISPYDDFRENIGDKKLVIFGAGTDGKMTYDILRKNGISVHAFCDNDEAKWGSDFCGRTVFSPAEVKEQREDYYVVIASHNHAGELLYNLTSDYFPRENIWYPRLGTIYATTGIQYFDCPELNPVGAQEVFIDAGCFDADTSMQFAKWCGGEYKRIWAFEPSKFNYQRCKENVKLNNFELLPYATWNKKEKLHFSNKGSGSRVSDAGEIVLDAESIDNVLQGERATFIKLDVEGAEMETLKGAVNTIKEYKPRLAVSIYHKPSDIYEIPQLLMEYREDYRFYIRHYTSYAWETVLYAI
ncbi:MAG: FkbM family methyltransferase [Clostridium sp.]|nr:FkbM family methyltransferase [Clostridium sp.]